MGVQQFVAPAVDEPDLDDLVAVLDYLGTMPRINGVNEELLIEDEILDPLDADALREALEEGSVLPNDFVEGEPILCYTARMGALDSVAALLEAGADPELESFGGRAIDLAVISGNAPVARLLLQAGSLPGETPAGLALNLAAKNGDAAMVSLVAGYGYDLEAEEAASGETALIAAVSSLGSEDAVRVVHALAAAGADVNHPDREARATPLMYAADANDLALVSKLVCVGADIWLQDDEGASVLDYAGGEGPVLAYLRSIAEGRASRCRFPGLLDD